MAVKYVYHAKEKGGVGGYTDGYSPAGVSTEYARYEREILSSPSKCPFKVEFRDAQGNLIRAVPVPLKPSGEPKVHVF